MGERIMVNGRELNFNDLPPEPKEEYAVSVDGLGEIKVTKGEPPEHRSIVELYEAKMKGNPEWVDDGLLAHRNVTVYVCDGEDRRANGFDVHLNIGDNHEFEHICFDSTATLYDRSTLGEAWGDAADWLHETANTLQELANYIRANDVGHETCAVTSSLHIEGEYVPVDYWEFEMDCGGGFKWDDPEPPRCCPCCGKRIGKRRKLRDGELTELMRMQVERMEP